MANKSVVISESLLDVDKFGKPAKLTNEQAIALLIARIIMLEPGTNPLFPTMGVGLVSRFRFTFANKESELKKEIRKQLETFLPDFQSTSVEFVYNNDKTVNIKIEINDVEYIYDSAELIPLTLDDIKTS